MSKTPQQLSARPRASVSRTKGRSVTQRTHGTKVSIEADAHDVLSDAMRSLALRSRIFCSSELTAPWTLAAPSGDFAHFHVVGSGDGWLHLPERRSPVRLATGDLIVLPRGKGHVLSDSQKPDGKPLANLANIKPRGGSMTVISNGGRGPTTRIICGSFHARRRSGTSLIAQLPDLLHVKGRNGQSPESVGKIIGLLTEEARQPRVGRGAVMTRLSDVLLIRVLRRWIESVPDQRAWLVALRDSRIGKAVSMIRQNLGHAWTVDELAKLVAMSRSAFAATFNELVGEPPLRYVARARMQRAAELLSTTSIPIEEIGFELGYTTTPAFHKAFKRYAGTTPGSYRRSA
jgi:AraC-like DNA-binding protein